jgi:hypothetical protein
MSFVLEHRGNVVPGAMKLIVSLHGTAIMHPAAAGSGRAERVQQVRDREPSVFEFAAYVPAEMVVEKLRCWREQGAEIAYLSSHRTDAEVAADETVLERHRFPRRRVLFRADGESYGEVVARELPDILIEDDCESIGAAELAYAQIADDVRRRVKSIVVPEFGGFLHLPDPLEELAALASG